jgi:hypothetical protein
VKLLIRFAGVMGVAGGLSLFASPVFANACAPHDEFSKHLETNYQEKVGGVGLANDGSLFEIFTSEKGSWSLLITNGDKISCIVAAGEMWVSKPSTLGVEAKLK